MKNIKVQGTERETMNLPININDLLTARTVEWERLEFKEGWNPEDVLHTMCAFVNDIHNLGGGYIVIGIGEKNGSPVLPPKGISTSQIDKIQKEILNLGHHALQPSYHPLTARYQISGKNILVLWVPGGDRFEEKIFKGPLSRMTRDALAYIQRTFLKETVIKHPNRAQAERFWNFPYAAIEEAIVNAVYHRSYEVREPIEVRITPEDFVVLSFPGPDRSIRMENLRIGKAVSRYYRNRRIGEFLKELDMTEGRSTGIPKILRTMKNNGSPKPEFETDDDRLHFLIRLPIHPKAKKTTVEQAVTLQKSPTQSPTQSTYPFERLLFVLQQGELSSGELRSALKIKHRPTFRMNYLHPALNAGLIERTIPDKPNSSKQKYRLTEKGKRHRESIK